MLSIRGGVKLRGDDDHRFFSQRWAERGQLVFDNFKIADGIAIVCVAGIHEMRDQSRALDMLQEARAQPRAFVRAFDQSRQIRDNKRAALPGRSIGIGGDDTEMRLKCSEGIGSDFRARSRNARYQSGFPSVGEAHQSDIGKQF